MSETIEQARAAITPGEERPSPGMVTFYRVIAPLSWLVTVILATVYTFSKPHDEGHHHDRHSIWGQNSLHSTPFTINSIITSIYWITVWLLQVPYALSLFGNSSSSTSSLILAPYFTLNHVFSITFIALWTRSYFGWALVFVILNFFNLTYAYLHNPKSPLLTHFAVLAAPLAFTFVALFWDGAIAFHGHRYAVAARIVANVFVWSWATYGGFYLLIFQDWTVPFCLSILACALGVSQFLLAIFALQWIFAFVIMAILFIASVAVAFPAATGIISGRNQESERAPLLTQDV